MSVFYSFEGDCLAYCKEHRIKAVEEEKAFLKKCIKISEDGVKVKDKQGTYLVLRPILNPSKKLTAKAASKLGRYKRVNDVLVFVYRDGNTYLADWSWSLSKLNMANFQIGRGQSFDDLPDFRRKDIVDTKTLSWG